MARRLLLLYPALAAAVSLRRTPLVPLAVTGKDAGAFLHAMLSVDVSTLRPNSHVDACLLTGQSILTDYLTVARGDASEWLLICEDASTVVRELEKRVVMEDVAFSTCQSRCCSRTATVCFNQTLSRRLVQVRSCCFLEASDFLLWNFDI